MSEHPQQQQQQQQVLFESPRSSFHPSFWETVYCNTLNIYGLQDLLLLLLSVPFPVNNGLFRFDASSFNNNNNNNNNRVKGRLVVVHTIEEFKRTDKLLLLSQQSDCLSASCPLTFVLLVYSDLKQYRFTYWLGLLLLLLLLWLCFVCLFFFFF